ncbi:unnamed protein product [Hapterophycus canaliculatus]
MTGTNLQYAVVICRCLFLFSVVEGMGFRRHLCFVKHRGEAQEQANRGSISPLLASLRGRGSSLRGRWSSGRTRHWSCRGRRNAGPSFVADRMPSSTRGRSDRRNCRSSGRSFFAKDGAKSKKPSQ